MWQRVFIGLGGNVGAVALTMQAAIADIKALPSTRALACSSIYHSPAAGGIAQADYQNAVLEITTGLTPEILLDELLRIERAHGRDRSQERRWGPRRIDLDILLFGGLIRDLPQLCIPHPRLAERAFVLLPLTELDKDLTIPGLGALMPLVQALDNPPIHRDTKGRLHV
jgi:2-amino-4-hydroxy-6-hydroxymethyldihydropteridine diphosphokinase